MWPEPDLVGFLKNCPIPDLPELEPKSGTTLINSVLMVVTLQLNSIFRTILAHEVQMGNCNHEAKIVLPFTGKMV